MATIFFGNIDRSRRNMENIQMEVDALGCMNNVDFEEKKIVNDNIVLDVFIICQKL